ncbi:unnamed protein product, partial [Laminaria digitata]
MRQGLTNCGWILACLVAASLLSTELGVQAQQEACDSQTWELTADGPFSPDEITSALAEAAACNGTNVVSVKWVGSMEAKGPFSVQAGVELRIVGEGTVFDEAILESPYDSSVDAGAGSDLAVASTSSNSNSDSSSSTGSGSAEPSVISSSNGTTSLFVIEVGGALHLSNMTLTGAWGGEQGGGAVHTSGGLFSSHNCKWASIASTIEGGALYADEGASVSFTGINVFEDCAVSAGGDGGGAVYLGGVTTTSIGGVLIFENCTSGSDGGAMFMSTGASLTFSPESSTHFRGSHADDKGGAMYLKEAVVEVAENASVYFFKGSSGIAAGGKGGGVCSYRSNFTVGADARLTFLNNSSPTSGDGGGMFGQSTVFTVAPGAALWFEGNSAGSSGGGLFLEWADDEGQIIDDPDAAPVGFSASCFTLARGATANFYRNSAGDFGGGAGFTAGCRAVISGNADFLRNSAVRAGAMVVDTAGMEIPGDVYFAGNFAERWGGAIVLIDSTQGLFF